MIRPQKSNANLSTYQTCFRLRNLNKTGHIQFFARIRSFWQATTGRNRSRAEVSNDRHNVQK